MPPSARSVVPPTYAALRAAVEATVVRGRQEIDDAWRQTYHETGRLILSHLLQFRDRAGYGAQLFNRLSADTGISSRSLHECVQFYRYFPIVRTCAQLGWSQCRLLCQVPDEKQRELLKAQAIKHCWTAMELQERVRACNALVAESNGAANGGAFVATSELLQPKRGTPGLHPVVDRGDGPTVDLGFKLYRALGNASKLTPGDIVRLNEDGVRRIDDATKAELFTYAATIRRVVDGDTLVVALLVAPGITLELKLRLRGLDCPEITTPEGRAAKRFVEGLVCAGDEVVLSTTKPDKYDRYLADVFVHPTPGSKADDGPEIFLNNALLENGHAVRYDGVGPKEE